MATSGRYSDSFATIRDDWTLDELYAAVDWINALADHEQASRAYAEAQAKARRH